ncbi:hypothetical protein KIMH_06750 [Bombiscardovia apis]|uniref:Uncharacterized protein n=1 Tax=Bombiscardovia apis TaxID=2932182 RepID=A0ABN6SFV4_9BIFI|nr:hypothetical protein KIMH_06750 [Bombiscardovia apis]
MRHQFGVDVRFPDAPGDELGILSSEINDKYWSSGHDAPIYCVGKCPFIMSALSDNRTTHVAVSKTPSYHLTGKYIQEPFS